MTSPPEFQTVERYIIYPIAPYNSVSHVAKGHGEVCECAPLQRVPLSEVLEMEAQKRRLNMSIDSMLGHALELRTRGNQFRAEALIHRKQSQVTVPIQEPSMYLPREEYQYLDNPYPPHGVEVEREKPPASVVAKKEPKHLTEEGPLVSGSVENGQTSKPTENERAVTTFLTDQVHQPAHKEREVARHRPRWQPLSSTAAQEYEGTSVVPVRVFSSQGHGRYSLWKPQASHSLCPRNSSPLNE